MLSKGALIYIGQRALMIVFTVVAVSSIVFLGIHRLPGNAFFSERLRGSQEAVLLHHYGLDQPLLTQYWNFLVGLVHGNLGESLVYRGTEIMPLVLREATVSAEVGFTALLFTVGLGILFGVFAAIRQNTWLDYLLSTTSVIGYSMPNFVIATFLLLVFGIWLDNLTNGTIFYAIGWSGTYGTPAQIWLPAGGRGVSFPRNLAPLPKGGLLRGVGQGDNP